MNRCPACSAAIGENTLNCPSCGIVLSGTQATVRLPTPKEKSKTPKSSQSTSASSRSEGHFIAGTVLDNRYRILGLLGRGGMGEVYKAEDLKLNQTVALKFLPEHFAEDNEARERFFNEVRTARQASHPNVCRVFDIGEVDGSHFLSMEFIDGDDLSSLLRRIGRLPQDKAIEIARQLCAGLHAIHQVGILHRDLKPANAIIDGQGKARITDFGIASLESELKDASSIAGTPAYMSPEQLAGRELTPKSDIYSLGLVLYEIFTGKRAFEADTINELIRKHRTTTPTSPSEFIKDMDPLVEKVIFRCLEKDARERPDSALQVAIMLPGGNPLEAAIAAGETPSPEMVAASPKKGALKPVVAVSLLATVFVCIGLTMLTSKYVYLHRMVPLDESPEVLRERSRELAAKFGYPSVDSYYGTWRKSNYLEYLRDNDKTPTRWQKLASGQPAVVHFWYRSSPVPLAPLSGGNVEFIDPPMYISGMARMDLDMKGRLTQFGGVPPRVNDAAGAPVECDWAGVFKEAGFNLADFESAESQWAPQFAYDDRRAWTGKYPEQPDVAIRVEAAAYRGRLVSFQIAEPWSNPPGQTYYGPRIDPLGIFLLTLFFGGLIVSAWLAVKNVHGGRSNVHGAIRITLFLFALRMIGWVFETHHVASIEEVFLVLTGLQSGLFWAGFAGLMYLAFEPYLRKHAPERVISWNRLLAGDWRDPLVGRDVLIGGAATLIMLVLLQLAYLIPIWFGEPPPIPLITANPGGVALLGIRGFPVLFLNQISTGLVLGFMASFLVLFSGLLLRHKWLGNAVVWLIMLVLGIPISVADGGPTRMVLIRMLVWAAIPTWLVLTASRFGVLAMVSGFVFYILFAFYPVTTELSAWYAGDFILDVVFLAALSIYGFYSSLAGQKIFEAKFLKDV